jgi:hypothetical protein
MVDIGFIGLGHMGFPMARRERSRKRNTAMMVKDVRLCLDEAEYPSRSPKPSLDSGKPR